ncbi:MAG: hypothetical protein HUK21_12975 [Fibrobacteraceae bacterium]|nr:hypothetical protein [Fibrobacteraceae bacterium]
MKTYEMMQNWGFVPMESQFSIHGNLKMTFSLCKKNGKNRKPLARKVSLVHE